MTLSLPSELRAEMLAHTREGAPEEVVGVLAGDHGAKKSEIKRCYRADNAAATPRTRYEIAPTEELDLLERIDAAGLDVVGFYHSHPRGPAEPSDTDARLAAWPDRSYVIVSLPAAAELGSWRWRGERFEREKIRAL
jgi:proteasome lid subunit RPN8/RPN11